jgi:predicted DNA-binding protein with PD1-like motif
MHPYALRLHPGQDLKKELDAFVAINQIEAACVLTCVGSLRKACLRFANQENGTTLTGFFEIVSLTGVLSIHGSHYHISISDGQGQTFGAHLLEGSEIYTTAEIILSDLPEFRFLRRFDDQTGYPELEIIKNI